MKDDANTAMLAGAIILQQGLPDLDARSIKTGMSMMLHMLIKDHDQVMGWAEAVVEEIRQSQDYDRGLERGAVELARIIQHVIDSKKAEAN